MRKTKPYVAVLLFSLLLSSRTDFSVASAHEPDRPFDQYGTISWNDEKARLDNFVIQLQHYETLMGYILVYDVIGGCPGEAQARAIRAKRYLVEHRGLPWNRLIWRLDGHLQGVSTTLLLVPRDTSPDYPLFSERKGKDGPLNRKCRNKIRQISTSRW